MKKIIWGNTIVKNEDRFLWFALKSIIDFLDKIIIYDTGSTDHTPKIIEWFKKKHPTKIEFNQIGEVDAKGLTKARQKMLNDSSCDWILILDGDEIWWEGSIKKVVSTINETDNNYYALVNPVINLVGDVYHYQPAGAGNYEIINRKGHLNIRAINRKIPGLHIKNDYPMEGFYDNENQLIQKFGQDKLFFTDAPILHFTHLQRSTSKERVSIGRRKFKYELGLKLPKDFIYPKVLYEAPPGFVLSPWKKMSTYYKLRSFVETPFKKIKRKLTS